ncbi:hypothetical protein [Flavobacterium lacus]|nr:hypothetical protein [Flavobacterium lacus]
MHIEPRKALNKAFEKYNPTLMGWSGLKVIGDKLDLILKLKQSNPTADTSALEREIDLMVYELCGLSEEEIGIMEES